MDCGKKRLKIFSMKYPAKLRGWCVGLYLFLLLYLTGCAAFSARAGCPASQRVDLSTSAHFPVEIDYSFQFPLADDRVFQSQPFYTPFAEYGKIWRAGFTFQEYHAAEDYLDKAGTPVYAMADGWVSYTGPMEGYGWLVIIDHPRANLYSLYGHLSPSRWAIREGAVQKGQLIGFLGDPDENGGSAENPLTPHLHFGIRVGQRGDYPANGSWRWMAGWIRPCPQDRGWLQPFLVITRQEIPSGGFPGGKDPFWAKWMGEFVFGAVYLSGGVFSLIIAFTRKKPFILFPSGLIILVAGVIFYRDGWKMSWFVFSLGGLLMSAGLYLYIILRKQTPIKQ